MAVFGAADARHGEKLIVFYTDARRLALVRMLQDAESLGANAVRNVRFETSTISSAEKRQKTAGVVLLAAFGDDQIPVDTHVFRVSRRIGLADANTPEKVEELIAVAEGLRSASKNHILRSLKEEDS